MKKIHCIMSLAAALIAVSCSNSYEYPYQDPSLGVDERVDNLIELLTLEEKLDLLMSTQAPVERIGLPGFELGGEACHGVKDDGFTVFPQAIGLAATFDTPGVYDVFSAVSDEARARRNTESGSSVSFWTPNINIFRDPRWGRGQETYGEDPYLMSRMGMAVVRGLQGDDPKYVKAAACAKHFSVHSGPEPLRHRYNPSVSDRDLWDTYMYAFKKLVQDAGVEEVMCAYTRYEGKPCCGSSKLLQEILRDKWGFKGIVVSDCGAIGDFYMQNHHETHKDGAEAAASAVLSGTNIECGEIGGANVYSNLSKSLEAGTLTEDDIDAVLRPALALRIRLGGLDPVELSPWKDLGAETISSEENHALALKMARESMTLLLNDGTLPLDKGVKKLLVVGPNADDTEMQLGNYNGEPTENHVLSIVDAIRKAVPSAEIVYQRGCGHADNEGCTFLLGNDDNALKCEYFASADFSGEPIETHRKDYLMLNTKDECPDYLKDVPVFSARFTSHVKNDTGRQMNYVIRGNGRFKMTVDGRIICEQRNPDMDIRWDSVPDMDKMFTVEPGKAFDLVIEYVKDFEGDANFYFDLASFYSFETEKVDVPSDADAIIFVAGLSSRLENEQFCATSDGFYGGDRTKVELPAVQRQLLHKLHASGKPVVVVNCSGSAVSYTEDENQFNALLQAWYGGQAMGTAVADVLFGDYNPAGRLPVTVYASTSQLPDFLDYNMEGRTYRYFREKPEFAFGYGLSYTSFSYGKPVLSASSAKVGEGVELTVPVTNTGSLAGDEVVQVYVKCLDNPLAPIKALKGYSRVNIQPGQTASVKISLASDAFETFDYNSSDMAVLKGKYQIFCGSSSRDEDLQAVPFEIL